MPLEDEKISAKEEAVDEVKERVSIELKELLDKITNLTKFLHGEGLLKAGLSKRMELYLRFQLNAMTEYANWLQARLKIWGKTDEELETERGKHLPVGEVLV